MSGRTECLACMQAKKTDNENLDNIQSEKLKTKSLACMRAEKCYNAGGGVENATYINR